MLILYITKKKFIQHRKMVYSIKKRPSVLYLTPVTSEDIITKENCRAKSPSRNSAKMVTPTRTNSVERKFKLIKKKSSKDKDQLVKGNVLELKKDNSNPNNNNICDCPKSTATKLKNKSNKVWKNVKLFDAVLDDNFADVRTCLITDEMDVNEFNPEGTSVLHIASAAGYLDCLELLLECGGDVDATDTNSRTPLEYAVIYGNFECAALLIEHGADSTVIKNGIN